MKKRILIALLSLLCVFALVACGDVSDTNNNNEDGLQKARDYVKATYRDEAETTSKDFTRPTSVTLDGVSYSIVWTVADSDGNATAAAVVGEPNNGEVAITVERFLEVETAYVLTATISDSDGNTMSVQFNHKTPVLGYKAMYLDDVVTAPAVNTAYKLAMWQNNEQKVYYATGKKEGYYLATTTDVTEACDVVLEQAEGGYYIKLGSNYLTIVGRYSSNKLGTTISLTTDAKTVFSIGDNNEFIFTASAQTDDNKTKSDTFYIGTYSTYTTISASFTYYIDGDNASKIDDSQFPARLVKGTVINPTDDTPAGGDGAGTTTPNVTPSTDKTAAYTFTDTAVTSRELTAELALTLFNTSSTSKALVSVGVTKIYECNGDGGARPNATGLLKTGTSSANGQLVLTFEEGKKATKVEIKCHDFYKLSDSFPTNSNKVAVNGSDAVLAPYNADATGEVLTFNLDGTTNVVTFDFTSRVVIYEIIVTFA